MIKSDCIVIIPTYNEKENIEKIIRAVMGLEKAFNILVIDDGSPDGTANIVKGLMADEFKDRLFIIERSGKLGLGTAYIAGFKWALEHGYDYIFEMDADFSHDPNDLPRLYAACHDEGADVAIGYLRNHPSQRRRMTPKKASPKMPPLILLVPSRRLTKMTGTSLILKPIL